MKVICLSSLECKIKCGYGYTYNSEYSFPIHYCPDLQKKVIVGDAGCLLVKDEKEE